MKTVIAPSLLSADLSRLKDEVSAMEDLGLSWIHCDIMDGAFVPNLTFGPPVIRSLRKHTRAFLDCHLMVFTPEKRVPEFLKAGADHITLHLESAEKSILMESLESIKASGKSSGISIKPKTPVSDLVDFLPYIDLILLMSVEPGFGGQAFMEDSIGRLQEIKKLTQNLPIKIQIDGGISAQNAKRVVDAGAQILVVGSQLYGASDRAQALFDLQGALS